MFCQFCGEDLEDKNIRFCPSCGKRIDVINQEGNRAEKSKRIAEHKITTNEKESNKNQSDVANTLKNSFESAFHNKEYIEKVLKNKSVVIGAVICVIAIAFCMSFLGKRVSKHQINEDIQAGGLPLYMGDSKLTFNDSKVDIIKRRYQNGADDIICDITARNEDYTIYATDVELTYYKYNVGGWTCDSVSWDEEDVTVSFTDVEEFGKKKLEERYPNCSVEVISKSDSDSTHAYTYAYKIIFSNEFFKVEGNIDLILITGVASDYGYGNRLEVCNQIYDMYDQPYGVQIDWNIIGKWENNVGQNDYPRVCIDVTDYDSSNNYLTYSYVLEKDPFNTQSESDLVKKLDVSFSSDAISFDLGSVATAMNTLGIEVLIDGSGVQMVYHGDTYPLTRDSTVGNAYTTDTEVAIEEDNQFFDILVNKNTTIEDFENYFSRRGLSHQYYEYEYEDIDENIKFLGTSVEDKMYGGECYYLVIPKQDSINIEKEIGHSEFKTTEDAYGEFYQYLNFYNIRCACAVWLFMDGEDESINNQLSFIKEALGNYQSKKISLDNMDANYNNEDYYNHYYFYSTGKSESIEDEIYTKCIVLEVLDISSRDYWLSCFHPEGDIAIVCATYFIPKVYLDEVMKYGE